MTGNGANNVIDRDLVAELKTLRQAVAEREHIIAAIATKAGGVVITQADLKKARPYGLTQFNDCVVICPQAEDKDQSLVVVPQLKVNGH